MLKRAWFVLSALWALLFIANGLTKPHGILRGDWILAGAPFAIGWLPARIARFIVTGSPLRPPFPLVPYRRP